MYPDGRSILVTEGIVRMRWRDITDENKKAWPQGQDSSAPAPAVGAMNHSVPVAAPMEAGRVYRIEVDMWNTALIVNAGHSVRLTVSSSNSPRFSANLNNGEPLRDQSSKPPVVAANSVVHDSQHPSALVLPVVPLSEVGDAPAPSRTPARLPLTGTLPPDSAQPQHHARGEPGAAR